MRIGLAHSTDISSRITLKGGVSFTLIRLRGGAYSTPLQAESLIEARQKLNTVCRETMELPADQIGGVIGKGGAVIKELERMSSCQIWVDPKTNIPGLPTRTLNLQGVPTRIEAAKRMILDRMALHESTRYSVAADGTVRDTLNIPEEWVGSVIGKGGSVIKSIMQASPSNRFILESIARALIVAAGLRRKTLRPRRMHARLQSAADPHARAALRHRLREAAHRPAGPAAAAVPPPAGAPRGVLHEIRPAAGRNGAHTAARDTRRRRSRAGGPARRLAAHLQPRHRAAGAAREGGERPCTFRTR